MATDYQRISDGEIYLESCLSRVKTVAQEDLEICPSRWRHSYSISRIWVLSACSLEPFLRPNVLLHKSCMECRRDRVYDGVKAYLDVEEAMVGEQLDLVLDLDVPVAPIVHW